MKPNQLAATISIRISPIIATVVFLVLVFEWSWTVRAQTVPNLINYQAKLADASGNPLASGIYAAAFKIWTNKVLTSNEQLVWGQEYTNLTVVNGMFNVILGSSGGSSVSGSLTNDLTFAFSGPNRFIGITVTRGTNGLPIANATEIVPRQQILSAPYAINAVHAQVAETVVNGIPEGSIISFGGLVAPPGWFLCDGTAVSRTAYSRLFAVIGTTYGVGDGTSTFNLPNAKGRVSVGLDVSQAEFDSLGKADGEKTHKLSVAEMPSHDHGLPNNWNEGGVGHIASGGNANEGGISDRTDATGGGLPHNNLQPYLVLNYIIKY